MLEELEVIEPGQVTVDDILYTPAEASR